MENITEMKYSEGYCKQVGTTRQILPCVHEESFYCFKEMLGSWSVFWGGRAGLGYDVV